MKRKLAAVLIGLSLVFGATACGNPNAANPQPQQEQEDCDFEDWMEGDEDCD